MGKVVSLEFNRHNFESLLERLDSNTATMEGALRDMRALESEVDHFMRRGDMYRDLLKRVQLQFDPATASSAGVMSLADDIRIALGTLK